MLSSGRNAIVMRSSSSTLDADAAPETGCGGVPGATPAPLDRATPNSLTRMFL